MKNIFEILKDFNHANAVFIEAKLSAFKLELSFFSCQTKSTHP